MALSFSCRINMQLEPEVTLIDITTPKVTPVLIPEVAPDDAAGGTEVAPQSI